MFVRREKERVIVLAPAKLNLFLEILSKRDDGFHEIETLMTAVDIFDTLELVSQQASELTLSCRWANGVRAYQSVGSPACRDVVLGDLPQGDDNIVMRAVRLLRQRSGTSAGAEIYLNKRIPSAAGLGGASSDAAAALVAANTAWGIGWSDSELSSLAAELGSDVPFFLGSGAAICRGRGEKVEAVTGLGNLHFVVVRPPEGLSTVDVFRVCEVPTQHVNVKEVTSLFQRGRITEASRMLVNRLQQPAESLSRWIGRLRDAFQASDCLGHQMSGSGSSYFGVCRSARHARRVAQTLRARNIGSVWHLRPVGI